MCSPSPIPYIQFQYLLFAFYQIWQMVKVLKMESYSAGFAKIGILLEWRDPVCCSTGEEIVSGHMWEIRLPEETWHAPVSQMDLLVLLRLEMCICRTPGSVSSVASCSGVGIYSPQKSWCFTNWVGVELSLCWKLVLRQHSSFLMLFLLMLCQFSAVI